MQAQVELGCTARAGAARSGDSDGERVPYLPRRWGGSADHALRLSWISGVRALHVYSRVSVERLRLTF